MVVIRRPPTCQADAGGLDSSSRCLRGTRELDPGKIKALISPWGRGRDVSTPGILRRIAREPGQALEPLDLSLKRC